jgi:hypothetical protein
MYIEKNLVNSQMKSAIQRMQCLNIHERKAVSASSFILEKAAKEMLEQREVRKELSSQ